jgi:hypothetical protein
LHQNQNLNQNQLKHHAPPKNEWKVTTTLNESSKYHDDSSKDGSSSFDWSEDVMNTHSLPHDVNLQNTSSGHNNKFDENRRHRHRGRRNRR